ncbi:MAG: hypothetical protein H6704_28780 [Myxococcales bacterium]|nr:hypothetical protein [Myxococcales bacterium]
MSRADRLERVALWGVLGVMGALLAAPLIHLWDHHDDHHHTADGAVVWHRTPASRSTEASTSEPADEDEDAPPPEAPAHGALGLAHLGATVVPGPTLVLPPPPTLVAVEAPRIGSAPARRPTALHPPPHRARGPPI